eukprot:TCALIF_06456-PB protein Name:"Protein of unknown function" AED:0.55 eAED:1.00 QI:0/0/0/0.5/1/1/2/0/69
MSSWLGRRLARARKKTKEKERETDEDDEDGDDGERCFFGHFWKQVTTFCPRNTSNPSNPSISAQTQEML